MQLIRASGLFYLLYKSLRVYDLYLCVCKNQKRPKMYKFQLAAAGSE